MLSFISHLIISLGLLLGTFTDLKTREVPDWLNFSLIGLGLGLGFLESIFSLDFHPLLFSFLGLLLGVFIGYFMFYAGQWGGGDAKLIMGLGALFGLSMSSFHFASLPLFVIFIINTVFVGALYGFFWAFFIALKKFKSLKKEFIVLLHKKNIIRLRFVVLFISVLFIVLAFVFQSALFRLSFIALALIVFFTFYLWLLAKAIETSCMVKRIPLSKLTEGDWIYEDIWLPSHFVSFKEHFDDVLKKNIVEHIKFDELKVFLDQIGLLSASKKRIKKITSRLTLKADKRFHDFVLLLKKESGLSEKKILSLLSGSKKDFSFLIKKNPSFEKIFRDEFHYSPLKKYVSGPKELGITKEQILILKKNLVKSVLVKEGIPFVPSFLIAYIITMVLGNWLLFFF